MAKVITWQDRKLVKANRHLIQTVARHHESRSAAKLRLLEATAARLGGFDMLWFNDLCDEKFGALENASDDSVATSETLVRIIDSSGLHPSLAIAALASRDLDPTDRRRSGSFYTDQRLSTYLAEQLDEIHGPLLDPAAGSGILLGSYVLNVAGDDRRRRAEILAEQICAGDHSKEALRTCLITLASLVSDRSAILKLANRIRYVDSLVDSDECWADIAPRGFGGIVTNPPWEKLKVSRHEHLLASGEQRHYGADYSEELTASAWETLPLQRRELSSYLENLLKRYRWQGKGEKDLYGLFVELALRVIAPGGKIAAIVPGGLLRSKGTEPLRNALLNHCDTLNIHLFENRARYFDIDTRFKFTVVLASRAYQPVTPESHISLRFPLSIESSITATVPVVMTGSELRSMRPDATLPEVRSEAELDLFRRLANSCPRFGESAWSPNFSREIDMTNDRHRFHDYPAEGCIPLIEGRVIHQYSSCAKSYVCGRGRAAKWEPNTFGATTWNPQFWVKVDATLQKALRKRVGFCDVTGQTNERTMLTAEIPEGVICGNKVPTIAFGVDKDIENIALNNWLAIANSFVFDWLLRRVITTSANFFIVKSIPVPDILFQGLPARRISELVSLLYDARGAGDIWEYGKLRAEIDCRVARAYDLNFSDLNLILEDFRLLDRGQKSILSEERSTVTKDLVLSSAVSVLKAKSCDTEAATRSSERLGLAQSIGSVPYCPSEYAKAWRPKANSIAIGDSAS